jgi:hypothetical protein
MLYAILCYHHEDVIGAAALTLAVLREIKTTPHGSPA